MRKLILVDGSGYLYRAFHALPPLTTARGEPTGAVLGVLNMLNKMIKEEAPERIAVVFDAPGRTFRDDLFDQYKAHRAPMPDDLRAQVEPLFETVAAMGLPLLRVPGVEADDVIGTLAKQAADAGFSVIISTGDKDMAQLVQDNIGLLNTMSNTRLDRAGVKGKFDVFPEQIIDYLALVGDSSDNIPGITGVGPKTAAKWLAQYQNLDNLIAHAADIGGKVGENLRGELELLDLSRKLATIDVNLKLEITVDGLTAGAADNERLRQLYTRLEFRTLLKALPAAGEVKSEPSTAVEAPAVIPSAPPRHYEKVLAQDDFDALLGKLKSAKLFALDLATTSEDYMRAEIVGVSFALAPGEACYVPLAHDYTGAPAQLKRDQVLESLKPLLEDGARIKVSRHSKFDAHVLANHGITFAGGQFDVMLESYVVDSVATSHELETMAPRYLAISPLHYEDIAGKGAKQLPFNQLDLDRASEYAAEAADLSLALHATLFEKLESSAPLKSVYSNIELPLAPVLERMERAGVLVDKELLKRQSGELAARMQELQKLAHEEAGGSFNVDSPKQLQEILFGKLGIPVTRRTPSGQPSTAEDVLEELAAEHKLPQLILEYRGVTKLKSTYTDKLPGQVNERTGRIHTSYHQAVAATGRLSSADPNLQNIPIRTQEGRRIRQAFVAPPGQSLIAADYSQIELRIMAHLSKDESLLKAFAEDRDVHQATAAEVFATPLDEVSDDQRRSAKAINFGLMYGMSAFGLARQLGIARGEAQKYMDRYFERYPGVRRYMDETRRQARESGYVETVFGRRLYLPDIHSRNAAQRQYAERSAINAPMQGTAADIIKRAMIEVDAWLRSSKIQARLILQVHDELILEAQDQQVDTLVGQLLTHMGRAAELSVPLKVDVGVGRNWDEAH